MAPFVYSVDVDRPAEEVFAYATNPARFSEWQKDVVSVSVEGSDVGSRFITVRKIGGSERDMTQEITENTPPHRWAVRGVDGQIRPTSIITVEPLDGGRCRATFSLDFDASGMAAALVPLVRRLSAKAGPASYERLKELLEGQVASA
jgi:uncharacterized membrane protein